MSLACGDYKTASETKRAGRRAFAGPAGPSDRARKEAGGAGTGAPLDSAPLEAKVQAPAPRLCQNPLIFLARTFLKGI